MFFHLRSLTLKVNRLFGPDRPVARHRGQAAKALNQPCRLGKLRYGMQLLICTRPKWTLHRSFLEALAWSTLLSREDDRHDTGERTEHKWMRYLELHPSYAKITRGVAWFAAALFLKISLIPLCQGEPEKIWSGLLPRILTLPLLQYPPRTSRIFEISRTPPSATVYALHRRFWE